MSEKKIEAIIEYRCEVQGWGILRGTSRHDRHDGEWRPAAFKVTHNCRRGRERFWLECGTTPAALASAAAREMAGETRW
jgi:hypothetical protein